MLRRWSAASRSGKPGRTIRATRPSGRVIEMSPPSVWIVTPVMPGPRLLWTATGTPSPRCSHEASRSARGVERCALTLAAVIRLERLVERRGDSARHGVIRVQARSVSPAV